LTGIRPSVAQTVVSLGLDLSSIVTLASLREGLSLAIERMAGGDV
jgi:rsbT co-antagonist protein RsbR